jgi:hypothetical protein
MFKFIRGILISPIRTLREIENKNNQTCIYVLFTTGAVITFIKSFFVDAIKNQYFDSDQLVAFFSFLNIPQIKWLIAYTSYIIFVFLVYLIVKLIHKKSDFKKLLLGIMAVSALGIILHFLFLILGRIFPAEVNFFFLYIAILWGIVLTALSIQISQNISPIKSWMYLIATSLPIVFISGITGILPYYAWLNLP